MIVRMLKELPRPVCILSAEAALFGGIAAFLGLVVHAVYRQVPLQHRVQLQGQDFATLAAAVPLIFLALARQPRQKAGDQFLLLGMLGYLFYTYSSYTLLLPLTPLFLLYCMVAGLSFFGLVAGLMNIEAGEVRDAFPPEAAVRPVAAVTGVVAGLIAFFWMGAIFGPFFAPRWISPESVAALNAIRPILFLHFVMLLPVGMLGAFLLWEERSWGYVLVPVFLMILSAILLALVMVTLATYLSGLPYSAGLGAFWALLCAVTVTVAAHFNP